MTENVLIAILGGGNAILFVKFLIERHDKKVEKDENEKKDDLKGTLEKLEKDGLRTQLLLLLLLLPSEQKEILTIAEHYFRKPPNGLGGNWYMTSLFDKWIIQHNSGIKPEWFKTE